MNQRLGVGAMLAQLGGNNDSVKAWKAVEGKTITALTLDPDGNDGDGALRFDFEGGPGLELYDCARSCCEARYMHTDDDLAQHVGATLLDAEHREAQTTKGEWDVHEMGFLVVKTSAGSFTVETHNEHNGYYGGINVRARVWRPPVPQERET